MLFVRFGPPKAVETSSGRRYRAGRGTGGVPSLAPEIVVSLRDRQEITETTSVVFVLYCLCVSEAWVRRADRGNAATRRRPVNRLCVRFVQMRPGTLVGKMSPRILTAAAYTPQASEAGPGSHEASHFKWQQAATLVDMRRSLGPFPLSGCLKKLPFAVAALVVAPALLPWR